MPAYDEQALAQQLAERGLSLMRDEQGLALVRDDVVVRADFSHLIPRCKPANLSRELIVRAARCKHLDHDPLAIDATAGLGEDSLLLAAAGFHVQLYERNPVIAALLRDALERAADLPQIAEAVSRMQLVEADSVSALPYLDVQPDVVLLDPMFPPRRKSAAVKKKLQLLQQLEEPCDTAAERALLEAALAARPRKVIIKRPLKGPNLADRTPDYSLTGKAVRYDCIVVAR